MFIKLVVKPFRRTCSCRRLSLQSIVLIVVALVVIVLRSTSYFTHVSNFERSTRTTDTKEENRPNSENDCERLTFLSLSYHAAPVHGLIVLLQPFGVRIVERGMNAYGCQFFNNCRTNNPLKVVDTRSVHQFIGYGDVDEFYSTYRDEFRAIDAFLCMHAAATCELFVPFKKPIIVIATIRYDNGRVSLNDWKRWNEVLVGIAADPDNVIAANNYYDVEYTRYYTGLSPQLLPSRCQYTRTAYHPTRAGFLLGVRRDLSFQQFFVEEVAHACAAMNVTVDLRPIRSLYAKYEWHDLASHRGIVALPCQPSMMALFEQYRMNIPLFLPSQSLLVEWTKTNHRMLNEMYSHFAGDKLPSVVGPVPDPNERNSTASLHYWLALCDWYTDLMPHVVLYKSVYHLVELLNSTMTDDVLIGISRRMQDSNRGTERRLADEWEPILGRVKAAKNRRRNMMKL